MSFSYLEGLQRAESEGLIVRSLTAHADRHSHVPPLGSLGHFNTRGLQETCALLLAGTSGYSRALVLGGGTGTACDDMKVIAPQLHLESVSFTPFNPYLRIAIREYEIFSRVREVVGEETLLRRREGTTYEEDHQRKLARYRTMPDEAYAKMKRMSPGSDPRTDHDSHVPTFLAEELQTDGRLSIFQPLEHPVCDKQHVVHFPDEFSSTETFDLIYDDKGPLYYVDDRQTGTPQDATVNAARLLSPKGLLLATHHTPLLGRAAGIREALGEDFQDALFLQGSPELLVVREQHALHDALRRCVERRDLEIVNGVVHLWTTKTQELVRDAMRS